MGQPRILIVEDEPVIADYLNIVLTRNGYQVDGIVSSGPEAVATTVSTPPHLVLMDIKIGGSIDGIGAAARIREMTDVPVVYVTAHADQETKAKAMKTEPSGYLIKPFKSDSLIRTVAAALGK